MLKTRDFQLAGRDAGLTVRLSELAAIPADRTARAALLAAGCPVDGGVIALAYQHLRDVREALGEAANAALLPFVNGVVIDPEGRAGAPLDMRLHLRDWRNIERMQNMALLLHVDFMVGREHLEIPVRMQAATILAGSESARVSWCSPAINAVINSRYASYVELETVLGTEDVFNLAESINADSLREWLAAQSRSVRQNL